MQSDRTNHIETLPPHAKGLLALCRPGFENDLAAELQRYAESLGLNGFVRARPNTGLAVFESVEALDPDDIKNAADWRKLVFARQLLPWLDRVSTPSDTDRATPIVDAARGTGLKFDDLVLETPDSDAGRPLSGFCRRFAEPLSNALGQRGLLKQRDKPRQPLHVVFENGSTAWLCTCDRGRTAPWPGGIPRLRLPRQAGSRSTLKLAEALLVLLNANEREQFLRPGRVAVDLGAAPGGWSWQLTWRGLRVTAVDNGPIAQSVMDTGLVEHVRADGFTWRPRGQVDWMVCDMVEQPSRIAELAADWIASGRCRHTIFNLKLPMKKRLQALDECRVRIRKRMTRPGTDAKHFDLRIKHLYHDREEVTCYLGLRQ